MENTTASPRFIAHSIQQLPAEDVHSPTIGPTPLNTASSDLDRWFERNSGSTRRVVSLYPSLLTGRILAYFAYRLRFPFLVSGIRFAVHVVEFFILMSALGGVATFTVMVLRAGSLIVSGAWWGLLEVMRGRLRGYARSGQRDAAEREIGSWLVLAVILAIAVIALGAVALQLMSGAGDDAVGRFYAFLVIVELAIGLPVRVLHSGIYATRRVYKPIWSMFVPTGVQLAVLGAGLFYYPKAAIIISIVAANAITIWITVHFCLEAYRMVGLRPRFGPPARWWRDLPRIPPWLGFETTISGLSFRLDAVLVLILVGFYGTDTRTFDLTAADMAWRHVDAFQFFYLILPLFRGTYESSGIFYFDLVRLRNAPAIRSLQQMFFHALVWLSPVIALYYWVLAAGLGQFVLHDVPMSFLLALIPMFLVRSVIGIYQIRLFAEGRFGTHIATLALLCALMWLVWLNPHPASDLIQITAAMVTQLIVLINVQHFRDRRDPPEPALLSLREWVDSLARESGPVLAGTVTIPQSITAKQRTAAVRLMEQEFDGHGHVGFHSPTLLMYYERQEQGGDFPAPHIALQTATGGALGRGTSLAAPAANGHAILERISGDPAFAPPGDAVPCPADLGELVAQFRTLFPTGIVFDLQTRSGAADMRTVEPEVLATLLQTAIASLEEGVDVVALPGRLLTPLREQSCLRLLLLLPADPEHDRVDRWLTVLRTWKLGRYRR